MKGAEMNRNDLAIAEAAHSVHILGLPPIDGDDSATVAPEDDLVALEDAYEITILPKEPVYRVRQVRGHKPDLTQDTSIFSVNRKKRLPRSNPLSPHHPFLHGNSSEKPDTIRFSYACDTPRNANSPEILVRPAFCGQTARPTAATVERVD